FPCGVGQGLYAAMELPAATVEDDAANAFLLGPLGDQCAHRLGGIDIAARFSVSLEPGVHGRSGGQRVARIVIDELRVRVLQTAKYIEARALSRSDHFVADAAMALLSQPFLFVHSHPRAGRFPTYRPFL